MGKAPAAISRQLQTQNVSRPAARAAAAAALGAAAARRAVLSHRRLDRACKLCESVQVCNVCVCVQLQLLQATAVAGYKQGKN